MIGAINLLRATHTWMHQNLRWTVDYSLFAFPPAAGIRYPLMFSLEIAALATSGSLALAAINAIILERTRQTGITDAAASPGTRRQPRLEGAGN